MSEKKPATEIKEQYKREVLKKIPKSKEEPILNKTQHLSEFDNKWNMNNKILDLFADNIKKDQDLKEKYAIILIVILVIQLVALIVIFILKGCNVLNYSDATFNIFIAGGIAEVFVLVKIIVEYLFKDSLTNALNIILENNNKKEYRKKKYNNKKSDKPREI